MSRLPLVSPLDRVLFLKSQPALQELPSTSLAALAQYTEERFISAGEAVFPRGAPPDKIHFIASGGVRTQHASGPPFDVVGSGGVGVIDHLAQLEEPSPAWALTDTLALCLPVNSFMQILEDDFSFYLSLATQLTRSTMDALLACGPKRPAERGFSESQLRETFTVLDLVQRLAQAREAPFFEGSNLTVMTELLRFQESRTLRAGDMVFEKGTPVESLALILDGTCVATGGGGETLHPAGSVLGAWELFTQQPRRETTQAVTSARLIEIERTLFTDVLEDHFEFSVDYLRKLCRRLIELRSSMPVVPVPA